MARFSKGKAATLALAAGITLAGTGLHTLASARDTQPAGEIRFSWWGGQLRHEKTEEILQLFEEENPGISVVREGYDWQPHWDTLTIQATNGSQPCVIQMQTRMMAAYARPAILRPLDDLIETGTLDVGGIAEPVVDSGRGNDGNLYMVPTGVFYVALMYNQSMLEDTGVEPPDANWTWSEFADFLREIGPELPRGVNPTHNLGRETDAFVNWVQSQGHTLFHNGEIAFPPEVVADWFSFWEELREDGLTDTAGEAIADNGSLIAESNIANGRTFMTNRPANRLDSHQKVMAETGPGDKLSILPYPRAEDGTLGMDVGANGMAIGATCPDHLVPAAAAWINFFAQDPRAAAIYESDNGVVTIPEFQDAQASSAETSRGQREQIVLFQQMAPEAKPVNWPAGGYGAVTEALNRAYDALSFESITLDEAVEQFMTELSELLA